MEMGNSKGVPPIIMCIMGGMIVFILFATFGGVSHVADELMWMGGIMGFLFFVTGMYDVTKSESNLGRNVGWG